MVSEEQWVPGSKKKVAARATLARRASRVSWQTLFGTPLSVGAVLACLWWACTLYTNLHISSLCYTVRSIIYFFIRRNVKWHVGPTQHHF